jgi:hypothetical protein
MADVISTGEAFSSTDAKREVWKVATEVAVGTALLGLDLKTAGVAYVNSGGHTRTDANSANPASITGIPDGGVGLDALQVTVATDGTYEFAVATVTIANSVGLALNGTPVYAIVSSGRITGLTLVSTSNTLWGYINNPQDYTPPADGVACVRIGG